MLSEITQVDDYALGAYRSSKTQKLDEQTRKIFAGDDSFSIQLLEDKASNGYLQLLIGRAFRDPALIRRFVSDAVFERETASFLKEEIVFNRLYLNDVTLLGARRSETTSQPAPPASTNPSRAASKGRDAVGPLTPVDRAPIASNRAALVQRASSAPPTITRSCLPS